MVAPRGSERLGAGEEIKRRPYAGGLVDEKLYDQDFIFIVPLIVVVVVD